MARRADMPIPDAVKEAQMVALDGELPKEASIGPYQYRPMIGSAGRIVIVLREGEMVALFMGRTPTLDASLYMSCRGA